VDSAVPGISLGPVRSAKRQKQPKMLRGSQWRNLTGWVWQTINVDDAQFENIQDDGRIYYHHITYIPEDKSTQLRISVEDLVAIEANSDDEETRELKLKYWVGQVAALFEENGEQKLVLRFFDLPAQWRYMNGDDPRLANLFGDSFRKFELLESDVCEVNPVEVIKKKLNWWTNEADAIADNRNLKADEIPNGFFTDRMVVRCGSDGMRRHDLSDSLWPAPPGRRRNRLLGQCPVSRFSLDAASRPKTVTGRQEADPVYSRAVECLKLSVLPENLPCREEETSTIREFVKAAVRSMGSSGNVLYISGVPGTGKTASVLSEMTRLQKTMKFEFIYINSMKLNTPTDLYLDLFNKLWIDKKRKFRADKPLEKLTEYFSSSDENRPITVLLVDEIDYLVNKSQAVVYQLFDWPLLSTSKLVLLTISNTMDLPERLMPRVASRLGLARLNYLPYNSEQIRKVVSERLKEAKAEKVFAEDAVRFAATRVAMHSGDVRKALQICRRAIELREGPIVNPRDVHRAQLDLYSSPFIAIMAHLPYIAKVVLIALVRETEEKNAGSVILRDVYYRFSNILKTFGPSYPLRPVFYSDFSRVIQDLKKQSLIKVAKQSASSLASYVAETRFSAETPDAVDIELQEASEERQTKNLVKGNKRGKGVQATNKTMEEDDDGANYLICLNELIEGSDVRKALVDEAGDKTAQRLLL
jgi:Cdc6-like AAA superfamily ATPase